MRRGLNMVQELTILKVLIHVVVASQIACICVSNIEIIPHGASCQNFKACFTLKTCLLDLSSCFVSDAVVHFSSGNHFTDLEGFSVIRDLRNLTLTNKAAAVDNSSSQAGLANIFCSKQAGFAFINITDLNIVGIGFHNCGTPIRNPLYTEATYWQTKTYYQFFEGVKCALFIVNVFNLAIRQVEVNSSDGYGLFVINALGRSSISNSLFSHNNFRALDYHQYNPEYCNSHARSNVTTCVGGNMVVLFQDEIHCTMPILPEYVFSVTHSTFKYGVNMDYAWDDSPYYLYNAGGLSIFSGQVRYTVAIEVDSIVAHNNVGHNGANAVLCVHDMEGINTVVHVRNSNFMSGNADIVSSSSKANSGGLYVYYGACACDHSEPCTAFDKRHEDRTNIEIINCVFASNHGFRGAAILLELVVDDQELNGRNVLASFYVLNCTIVNNFGYVGIVLVYVQRTSESPNSSYRLKFILSETAISHNELLQVIDHKMIASLPERNYLSTVGVFDLPCLFHNNTISANSLVGLHLESCEVIFLGDTFISGNNIFGGLGGGIRLYRSSITLSLDCSLVIESNKADFGAGIYIDDFFVSNNQPCFFDVPASLPASPKRLVSLVDNKARLAGNSIYGGYIENCTLKSLVAGKEAFLLLFDVRWNNSMTEVSSQIHQLCFCENGEPKCHRRKREIEISPGQDIIISAVAVGQLGGTVPSVVLSEILHQNNAAASIGDQQEVQQLSVICGDLHYHIKALEYSTFQIDLQTTFQRQLKPTQSPDDKLSLYVNVTNCPIGFVQKNYDTIEGCDCIAFFRDRGVTCNFADKSFERLPPLWVGLENGSGLILAHDSCPFDYCDTNTSRFTLNSTDMLCRFQRTGILCGRCKQGLSIVFGSSRCKSCSNAYIALVLVFLIAGFLLVLALIYLDLTVADGTLNGLILYENIVKIHQAIIFPAGHTNVVTVLIAWLNLDLGFEVCFYNGFDAHTRTWLQYLFPVYIWIIIIIIIVLGWHVTVVARIVGSNSIPVLATLLLMSYTKLQRAVLESLSFTRVESHLHQNFYVWLYDGNVSYSDTKHIFLMLTACIFAIAFILPFTFVVLCGPVLQKKCSRLMLKSKLTAINDAYQGPYKTKYRWWTGAMLLVRTLLILLFTLNIIGDQRLNLLFIVTVCVVMLTVMWNVGTVYKSWWVNVIESAFVADLALLAAWCGYNQEKSTTYIRDQSIIAYLLVGAALLLFVATVFIRVIKKVKDMIFKRIPPRRYQRMDVPLEEVVPQNEDRPPTVTCTYIEFKSSESKTEDT